jgi:hypothetical protein
MPSDYPPEVTRFQFAVKLCFAVIIRKAQGQSLKEMAIHLREECFSHTVCRLLKSWFGKMLTYTGAHRKNK